MSLLATIGIALALIGFSLFYRGKKVPTLVMFGMLFLVVLLAIIVLDPARARAQGYGFTVSDQRPPSLSKVLDSRFYMPLMSTQGEITILCNVAGYVIYDDPARQPDYYILRLDDIFNVSEWADPLNAYAGYKPGYPQFPMHPDDKPFPTVFIFNEATIAQFDVHAPYIP